MSWFSTNTASSSHYTVAKGFFQQQDCLRVTLERLKRMYFLRVLSNFRRTFSRVQINYSRHIDDFSICSLFEFVINCCVHLRKLWFHQLSCYIKIIPLMTHRRKFSIFFSLYRNISMIKCKMWNVAKSFNSVWQEVTVSKMKSFDWVTINFNLSVSCWLFP